MGAIASFMGSKRRAEIERAVLSWHGRRSRRRRQTIHCGVPGCAGGGLKRGLCNRHYDSWWKAHRRGRASPITPVDAPRNLLSDEHACDDTCDLFWLAGLLEGEGTFTATETRGHAYPLMKVEMCAEDVVVRASRLLGAPSVSRREPDHKGWSPTYVAAISGNDAAIWMRSLRGHMGRRRTEAIDSALAHYHPVRLVDPPDSCVVPGCGEPHRGRGLCHKHYMMWSRDKAKGRDARITPLR